MYALASKLIHLPVLSLQSAETLTTVHAIIINPHTLAIAAFSCVPTGRSQKRPIIMPRDVRQIALDCFLIDTQDVIGEADEVVRLQPLMEHPYQMQGKRVVTEMHRTIGKVDDYVINLDNYEIQKLEVKPSLMQSWLGSSLMIDRKQIIEITPQAIIVREATTGKPSDGGWLGRKTATKP